MGLQLDGMRRSPPDPTSRLRDRHSPFEARWAGDGGIGPTPRTHPAGAVAESPAAPRIRSNTRAGMRAPDPSVQRQGRLSPFDSLTRAIHLALPAPPHHSRPSISSILDRRRPAVAAIRPDRPASSPGEWVAVALGSARSIARVKLSSGEQASLTLTRGLARALPPRRVRRIRGAPAFASVRLGCPRCGPDAAVPHLAFERLCGHARRLFEMRGGRRHHRAAARIPSSGMDARAVRYGRSHLWTSR